MGERLYRSRVDRMIGGVAAGVARALSVDTTIVRVAWVILAFVTEGAAVLVYFVLLFVMPEAPEGAETAPGEAAAPASPLGGVTPGGTPAGATTPRSAWSDDYARPGGATRASGDNRTAALVFGVILIGIGAWFLVRDYLPQIDIGATWPYIAVGLGVVLVVASLVGRPRFR
jgi:phage shock protein PspC (stress-responsive transcriptional regulator)